MRLVGHACFFLVLLLGTSAAGWSQDEASGQDLFVENKCNQCHPVESAEIERTSTSDKMKGMDLSDTGNRHDVEWLVKFLKKEIEREGDLHKKSFKGTDEDAQKIAAWLATLKTETP